MENIIKICFSGLATFFIYLFGGLDIALTSLLLLMGLDYLTGVLKASKKKKLSSKVGIEGIKKKVAILCLVALGTIVDRITGDTGFVRTSIVYYLVANEGLSIIENLGDMNVIVPEFLKDKLEQLKNKGDDTNE